MYSNDSASLKHAGNIKPCISTNSGIFWDLEKFENYKDKLDFWLLVAFGNISMDVIYKYGNDLDENRVIGTEYTRSSDWRDQHSIYCNGWENLLKNKNIKINRSTLNYLYSQELTLFRYSGNARDGHVKYENIKKANELVLGRSLDLSFEDLVEYIYYIPTEIFSVTKLDEDIYFKIIKPAFLSDKTLFNKMVEYM